MENKRFTLTKKERLNGKRYIDTLFEEGKSFVAFPLRIVYLTTEEALPAEACIFPSVAKKKIRRAVGRNRVKRLIRETYRLHKHGLIDRLPEGKRILVAFIYMTSEVATFEQMDKAMQKTIQMLANKIE